MKKILVLLLSCCLITGTLVACGDDDKKSVEKDSSSSSELKDKEDEEKSKIEEEKAKLEEEKAELEEKKAKIEEEKAELEEKKSDESKAKSEEKNNTKDDTSGLSNGVFTSELFTFEIDEDIWNNIEGMSNGMIGCAFSYVGDYDNILESATNFNVVSMDVGIEIAAEDYAGTIKAQYENMSGATLLDSKSVEVNGYTTYRVEANIEQDGITMKMYQYIFSEDGKIVIFSAGAEESVFENVKSKFDDILNTFEII